jgi:hypothetical protein
MGGLGGGPVGWRIQGAAGVPPAEKPAFTTRTLTNKLRLSLALPVAVVGLGRTRCQAIRMVRPPSMVKVSPVM